MQVNKWIYLHTTLKLNCGRSRFDPILLSQFYAEFPAVQVTF